MNPAGRSIGVVAVFALVGPGLAGAGVTLAMLAPAIVDMPEIAFMALFGVLFGYVIGLPPALLTGVAAAWLSGRIRAGAAWVGVCTPIGAVISGAIAPLIAFGGGKLSVAEQVGVLGGAGAFAALSCSLICLGLRPRPA